MNIYYKIWVDCIKRMKLIEEKNDDWKIKGLFFMSLAMSFNFVLIMMIFQKEVLGYFFYEISSPLLSGFANYALTLLFLYFLPCVIINYLLIIRNNRYEKLLTKFSYNDGKLCLAYYLVSFLLPSFLLLLGLLIEYNFN